MKALLIGGGVILSLVLGFFPGGLSKPKPAWWRILTVVSMIAVFLCGLGIPTGGTFVDAGLVSKSRDGAVVPVRATVGEIRQADVVLRDYAGKTQNVALADGFDRSELVPGQDIIMQVRFSRETMNFTATRVSAHNPVATLPLIPALEERARNLYLHVPTAWLAQIAWFVACFYAIKYLRGRKLEDDVRATAAAGVGALFCVLATVTGAIWAKFNWNVFWNWDPRQTSIFIVLIIYGAFFSLRSAIESDDQRAKLSSIYLALLTLPVLFFMFVMPRLMEGLHPGSANDTNAGPILSPQQDAIDLMKQAIFALGMFSWTLLYFWMLNIRVRSGLLFLNMKRLPLSEPSIGDN